MSNLRGQRRSSGFCRAGEGVSWTGTGLSASCLLDNTNTSKRSINGTLKGRVAAAAAALCAAALTALVACAQPAIAPGGGGDDGEVTYTVRFDARGGKPEPNAQTIFQSAPKPVTEPTQPSLAGSRFVAWFKNKADAEAESPDKANAYDFSQAVAASMTLYAGWKQVDGTFEVNNVTDWNTALAGIHEAGSGSEGNLKNYVVLMNADIKIPPGTENTFDVQYATIALEGNSDARKLELSTGVGILLKAGMSQVIEVKGINLKGAATNAQPLVYVDEGGAFVLGAGGKITGNTNTASHGGAIFTKKGAVTVAGGEISGNYASAGNMGGGAIYAEESKVVLSDKALIKANSSRAFGNVYMLAGSLTITDSDFIENLTVSPVVTYNGCTLTVDKSRFTKNVSSALQVQGNSTLPAVVSVKNSEFSENTNTAIGCYNGYTTGTIEDCTITKNKGYNIDMRGVYSTFEVSRVTIKEADGNYGIYINGGAPTAAQTWLKADLKEVKVDAGTHSALFITERSLVTVADSEFTNCTKTQGQNWGVVVEQGSQATLSGNTRIENNSFGMVVRSSKWDTTNNRIITAQTLCTMEEGVLIKANNANNNGRGRGVSVESRAKLVMNGGEISGHVMGADNCGGMYVSGQDTEFVMNGGSIVDNTGNSVGAIWMRYGPTFTMTGGLIARNKALAGNSGAIHISENYQYPTGYYTYGTFIMKGGVIEENENQSTGATVYAGGVTVTGYIANDGSGKPAYSTFIMHEGAVVRNNKFTGNATARQGGGVYVNDGKFVMLGGTISGNTGATQGGGIYITGNNALVTLAGPGTEGSGPKISGNGGKSSEAGAIALSGGGVYVNGTSAKFRMANGTVHGKDVREALWNVSSTTSTSPVLGTINLGTYDAEQDTWAGTTPATMTGNANNTVFIRFGVNKYSEYDEATEDPENPPDPEPQPNDPGEGEGGGDEPGDGSGEGT